MDRIEKERVELIASWPICFYIHSFLFQVLFYIIGRMGWILGTVFSRLLCETAHKEERAG